jgi:Na+-driven multidrug efflux pump
MCCHATISIVIVLVSYQAPDGWYDMDWLSLEGSGTNRKFSIFFQLGLGGMLASSEWIYWEVLSLMIGTLGVTELSVHTIPTQVIMLFMMPSLATGIALTIQIGHILPKKCSEVQVNSFVWIDR